MAAFFVGQRVRVVSAKTAFGQAFIGREGRIVEECKAHFGEPLLFGLDIDPLKRPKGGVVRGWAPYQLEPIVPDGMQPVEWSECLWQPEGVEA